MNKKRWLILAIIVVLGIIFWNLKFLGLSIVNTTSQVNVIAPYYFPIINGVNTSIFVCENQILYYEFNATDPDNGVLSGDISPRNPFFVFWINQQAPYTIFAIVSGNLSKTNAGGVNVSSKLYQETVIITDDTNSTCCSNTTKTNITVIEVNNPPDIENIGVQTVWNKGDNSTFYEVVDVADTEYNSLPSYGTLAFNVTITNSSGSQVSLFNITSPGGVIDFTANNQTPLGVYNVTLCVNDTGITYPNANITRYCNQTGGSLRDCDSFSLTVTDENRAPNITSYYPSNLSFSAQGTDNLYFNITKYDADGTIPDAYWYVDGLFQEYDSGNSTDEFFYSFGCGVGGSHNISVEITDGLLNDSLQWSISVSEVSCGTTPPSGGGGGGGGGGGAVYAEFEIDPLFITTTIFKEEGKSFDIKIKNVGFRDINIIAETQNLTDKAILSDKNFVVKKGETKTIRAYLYALSSAKPGVYYGKIIFGEGENKKTVNVVLEIKQKEALFDIKVNVPQEYKAVNPGTDIRVLVDLLNVGLYGTPVDVELYLTITDFDKLVISESSKEILAVKTNLSIERRMHVPLDTLQGTYIVLGEAKYGNITVTTYDTFNVVEKKYLRASYIIIIALIVILILFILWILWKRRKKKREERM
jgi:hypothetical protein